MHAVILAGGKGVRLRPYTTALPKPLVPIGDQHAILEIVLRQLARPASPSVHPRHRPPRAHHPRLRRRRLPVGPARRLRHRGEPAGHDGPAAHHADRLPEHFLVMNGDILTDLDYGDVLRGHRASGAPLTVATYARKVQIDFGVLDHRRRAGSSGSPRSRRMDYRVCMGVYGLSAGRRSTATRPGCPSASTSWCSICCGRENPPHAYAVRRVLARHRPPGRLRPGERRVRPARRHSAQGRPVVIRVLRVRRHRLPRPRTSRPRSPHGRASRSSRSAAAPAPASDLGTSSLISPGRARPPSARYWPTSAPTSS